MTQSKDHKERRSALLGMPFNTAERKLRKMVIYELAQQLQKNVCARCGTKIESSDDLALIHLRDWQDNPSGFWDLTNVAFSHVRCEATRHDQRQEETKKMKKVELKIEDEKGNSLPGVNHQGQIYIAAEDGERYSLRLKNNTGERLLAVTTVDGRNVLDGKPGSVDGQGYILEPFGSVVISGWRRTDATVAAFRFGQKKDSYSEQMGTPENVGVIGVAVFEEKPKPVVSVIRHEYIPVYPNPWWQDPWYPRWRIGSSGIGYGGSGGGRYGSITVTSTGTGDSSDMLLGASVQCAVDPSLRSVSQEPVQQTLGTGYGETLESSVVKTTFLRASEHPAEILEIRYDSLKSLRKQGIMTTPPSRRPKAPRRFPRVRRSLRDMRQSPHVV